MISRGINIAANGDILFFFMAVYYFIANIHHFFTHSSVNGHLSCFHSTCVHMNIGVCISFQVRIFILSGYMPKSGIAGSYGNSIFSFLRNLYSAIAIMHSCCIIYIPTNSIGEFPFLHTFPSVYYWSF